MKFIKYLLPAVLLGCLAVQSLPAQSLRGRALADSLLNEIQKAKSDTDRVKIMIKIARALLSTKPDSAMKYAENAMSLSEQGGWKKGVGLVYITRARIYRTVSDYTAGIENASKAHEIFKSLKWNQGIADALVETANNYEKMGNYSKSIENNFAALSIYEKEGLEANIASVYNNLGINYYRLKDSLKAIENYSKSLELHKKAGNKFGIASALDNIASVYLDLKDYKKVNEYNLEAIKLFEEINDKPAMGRIYFNRGNLMQEQKDFTSALHYYNKAIQINNELDIKSSQAFDHGGIAQLYLTLAKEGPQQYIVPDSLRMTRSLLLKKAYEYFFTALELSKSAGDLSSMTDFTKALSETEALRGNYETALGFYKESTKYKDSIFNDESRKKIAALENQRLAEVKNREIELLKRQTLVKNFIIAGVVISALFAFFLIRSFNRRRKVMLDKQIQQIEMKALRAQMNPHFIFNSLQSINRYVLENDKENASEYLSKFAKLMRLVLENSREPEVPLESDLAALELYMQLESLRFQNRFRYSIEIDPGIDQENTLIPPLMLQPFAENAIVHGIRDKENGLIKINIHTADNNMICCVVEDNGTGRKAVPVSEEPDKKKKSLGLKILHERLHIINQLKKVKAAVHIFDLKDAENKPGGLRIELLLPLQLAF